ncbi:MAG: UDP-N-acetylmuramoyl-tripeptide--D-alanyl-D-alanine ligase, partial [Silicimonas sp.]|nr:UDP-N-acetylmuramoyl-tripeptide--D-alanyl-D-alanine ligase [Silicimonas sp.]
ARHRVQIDPVEDLAVELIDDAFNANPASMAAAFEVLAAVAPEGRGRRVAILGDMLELGAEEAALHAALAEHPAMHDVALVHCVGPRMWALFDALPVEKRGHWCETAEDLAAQAHQLVRPGDVVLVKGSKGSRVSLLVAAIKALKEAREKGA